MIQSGRMPGPDDLPVDEPVRITVDKPTRQAIRTAAQSLGVSQSEVVRRAMRPWFERGAGRRYWPAAPRSEK